MVLAVNQPYLFPYVGYFQLIQQCDAFLPYALVDYVSKSWVNRNRFVQNDQLCYFSIPVARESRGRPIQFLEFLEPNDWFKRTQSQLQVAYAHAPYKRETLTFLEVLRCTLEPIESSADFLITTLQETCTYLEIDTPFLSFSGLEALERTVRQEQDATLRRHGRVVALCEHFGADTFLNLPGGKDIYDGAYLEGKGIQFKALELATPALENQPVPYAHASIIHLLMMHGKDQVKQWI